MDVRSAGRPSKARPARGSVRRATLLAMKGDVGHTRGDGDVAEWLKAAVC
jgi:hypothetical protein